MATKPPPVLQKLLPGPPGPPHVRVIRAPVRLLRALEYYCFGFSIITRTEPIGFGPDLVGILPMSLPQLSKQLRDQNNKQKQQKTKIKISEN